MNEAIPGPIRHVVLMGLMGSGKTTIGARLAERLGWPMDDSDAAITARTGRTVRALREDLGVQAMHDLEAAHLLTALAEPGPSVVTAAASTIDVPECRAALVRPGVMAVWLRGSPSVLAGRFASDDHRPSFGSEPATFLAEQAALRDPLFATVQRLTVDVDSDGPDDVAAMVAGRLAAPIERGQAD